MRFEDKKLKAQRRKGSWITELIAGPSFALLFCLLLFLPPLLTKDSLDLGLWFPLFGSIAAVAPLADRIGKRHRITAEQFAGPVAFCCILFGLLLFSLISILLACM